METLHFTLAHFNYDIHRIMFHETGYTSLNDYELNTTNSIFELSWNNYTGLFEREASSLEVKHLDPSQFYHRFVPMSSLCFDVKTYLFERFLSNSSYRCFEDYYINNYRQLADILVFVPWKSVRSVVVEDKNVKITVKFPFNPIVEAENTLDGFSFKLNGNNKKYILYSKRLKRLMYIKCIYNFV